MAASFGPQWTTAYGPSDRGGTWRAALSGLTGKDLARGLENTIADNRKFPPNASEFRGYCLDTGRTREQGALYGRIERGEQRALPPPTGPLRPEVQSVMDAHPEWQKGDDENSREYGRRMAKLCKELARRANEKMRMPT